MSSGSTIKKYRVYKGCGFIDRVRVTTRPGQGRGRRLVTRGGPPYPFKGCSNWLPIGLLPASGHAHVAGLYLEALFSFSLCLVSGCAVPARSYPTGNVRPHVRARSQPRIRGRPTTYLCLLLWSPRDMFFSSITTSFGSWDWFLIFLQLSWGRASGARRPGSRDTGRWVQKPQRSPLRCACAKRACALQDRE